MISKGTPRATRYFAGFHYLAIPKFIEWEKVAYLKPSKGSLFLIGLPCKIQKENYGGDQSSYANVNITVFICK